MKLIRLGEYGAETPAALVGGDSYVDLSDTVDDFGERLWLQAGDVIELGIDELGSQRQRVVASHEPGGRS